MIALSRSLESVGPLVAKGNYWALHPANTGMFHNGSFSRRCYQFIHQTQQTTGPVVAGAVPAPPANIFILTTSITSVIIFKGLKCLNTMECLQFWLQLKCLMLQDIILMTKMLCMLRATTSDYVSASLCNINSSSVSLHTYRGCYNFSSSDQSNTISS